MGAIRTVAPVYQIERHVVRALQPSLNGTKANAKPPGNGTLRATGTHSFDHPSPVSFGGRFFAIFNLSLFMISFREGELAPSH